MSLIEITLAGLFGLLVGSFLNVVIYRLPLTLITEWRKECKDFLTEDSGIEFPKEEAQQAFNVVFPRSHCPSCKQLIPAWCNIPVISYVILKGKCLKCKQAISIRYPAIELISALLTAFVVYQFGVSPESGLLIVFTWALLSLTFIDIDHKLLPDNITLPLLWLGLIANLTVGFTDLKSAVLGATFGYLSLWTVYHLFKLLTGKEGMGHGDFKLLAALGAWTGWQLLPLIIVLSSFVGAVLGIAMIVTSGKGKDHKIPFGPYLAIAGWIAFFWGEHLMNQYLGLLA